MLMDEASSLHLQSKVSLILLVAHLWTANFFFCGQQFGKGVGFVRELDRDGREESATASA